MIQRFPVTIPCKTYGIPTPAIAWTKNNVSIADNSEKYAVTKSGDLILRQAEVIVFPFIIFCNM